MRPENKQKDAKSSPRCSLLKLKSKGKRESNDIRKYLNRMSQDQSLIVKTSKTETHEQSKGDQGDGRRGIQNLKSRSDDPQ